MEHGLAPKELARIAALLVGKRLNSVEFVADDVQLHFIGSTVSLIAPPVLRQGRQELGWGGGTFRDALCGLIHQRVLDVQQVQGRSLEFKFESDTVLVMPLD